jgi:hypothetical protein
MNWDRVAESAFLTVVCAGLYALTYLIAREAMDANTAWAAGYGVVIVATVLRPDR